MPAPNKNNALVVHNPNQGGRSRRPRPDNRGRGGPRRPNPQWREQDDVSAVSDADYEEDYEEPRFKYSTAELRNASCIRNQKCCIASIIIVCLILAIVISLVVNKILRDIEEENDRKPVESPSMAPSLMPSLSSAPSATSGRFLRHDDLY